MTIYDRLVLLQIIEDLDELTPDILPQREWVKAQRDKIEREIASRPRYVGRSPRGARLDDVATAMAVWFVVVCIIVAVGWAYLEAAR